MKSQKHEANEIMKDMCIKYPDRRYILRYAENFAPNASNTAKFNRACRKARNFI